jgi:MoxR-like ATPase
MSEQPSLEQRPAFVRYRGDGLTPDGREATTAGEKGRYVPDPGLVAAVNAALAVEQPLLVTGEAGTGKTILAYSVAAELGLGDVGLFPVRSDNQGRDLLYEIDNLQRFYDAQVQDARASDRRAYLRWGVLGRAFQADRQTVVLVDEIDKAPRDFPNDLLHVLDRMEIKIPELEVSLKARQRPVVIITSNRESQLPDPFLRRCVFHHIEFPGPVLLKRILQERLGHLALADTLLDAMVRRFAAMREVEGLQKKPATSELITWARVLYRAQVDPARLEGPLADTPYLGTLLKVREDIDRVGRRPR